MAELIALAKSRPGDLTYGTAGVGTAPHMSGELFNLMTGAKLTHVPYRGTNQAIIDLIGGRLSLMFSPAPTIVPHLKEAKLKVLATTATRRSNLVPDLPPLAKSRPSRLRQLDLVRAVGAEGHAEGDRQGAQHGGGAGGRTGRRQAPARRQRRRPHGRVAGGVRLLVSATKSANGRRSSSSPASRSSSTRQSSVTQPAYWKEHAHG